MRDPHHEVAPGHEEMMTTSATSAARYTAGPSKSRPYGGSSAPGVAEEDGHQGAPEGESHSGDRVELSPPRAVDAAALRRVARRRQREDVQRKERVDVRYSVTEKRKIMQRAEEMEIAGAHLVGAVIMAYLDDNLALGLSGQRTQFDDYIDELNALRQQVTKIGHLVNQVAKKLNSGGHPHPGDNATLAHAERVLNTGGTAVSHIAAAANSAVTSKAP